MISRRKLRANRANARAGTGPTTAAGKARSARNAQRHGLTLPVMGDPALGTQVEALARAIAGADATPRILALARAIAEAQLDLVRVRRARHDLVSRALDARDIPCAEERQDGRPADAALEIPEPGRSIPPDFIAAPAVTAAGANGLAAVLSALSARLARLDRYERRSLSRRKFAVRACDAARPVLAEG